MYTLCWIKIYIYFLLKILKKKILVPKILINLPQTLNGSVLQLPQKYKAAQRFSTLKIIGNVSWAANQHIRMISEGSCDSEDIILKMQLYYNRNDMHFNAEHIFNIKNNKNTNYSNFQFHND